MHFLFTLLLLAGLVHTDFDYSHLGTEDGLKGQHIFAVGQTPDGVIWWAGKNTVDRYNGHQVKNYWLDKDVPYSHFSGRTIGLAIDGNTGSLYAYDNKGKIFRYDPLADTFVPHLNLAEKLGGPVLLNHMVSDAGGLWFALERGAYRLADGELSPILEGHFIHHIMSAGERHLLCATDGVYSLENHQTSFLVPFHVESGYYDALNGRIWLGTFSQGVLVLDALQPTRILAHVNAVPGNPVRCIIPYDKENLLAGVDGAGVLALHSRTSDRPYATILMDANDGPTGVLHGNGVYALLLDNWQNLYIGSYSGGIDIARPHYGMVENLRHVRNQPQSLSNDHVNCVGQLPDGRLVMGTDNGVAILNRATGRWTFHGTGLVVLDVYPGRNGSLLAATFGNGVWEISAAGQIRPLYSVRGGQLRNDYVYSLFRDRDGHLWMGCLDGDLVEDTGKGYRYYPLNNVQDICQVPDGRIAVGTADGLFLVTPGQEKMDELQFYPQDQQDGACKYVHSLLLKGQRLWVGTDGGGVYLYDWAEGPAGQITRAEGLPSNGVCSLCEDVAGKVWIATEEGLCYKVEGTPEAVPVNYLYGLKNEYVRGAVCRLRDGSLLLGSTDGAVLLDPGKVSAPTYTAPIRLLGVDFKARDRREFLDKTRRLLEERRLDLTYRQNTFSLHFESVNMRFSGDIAYTYQVDQGGWSQPTGEESIRFSEMEAGVHRILLRSISRSSQTVLDQITVYVDVAEPWWNSSAMWAVYFLLIVLIFWATLRVLDLHNRYMRLVLTQPGLLNDVRPQPKEETNSDGSGKEFVDAATRAVIEHLSESDFSIDDLCREMGMSRTYLYMRLKTYTGKSPQDFIRVIRMERAAWLLREGHSVADVSVQVGFDNPKYFSTVFKKYFDVSPSKYR